MPSQYRITAGASPFFYAPVGNFFRANAEWGVINAKLTIYWTF